MPFRSTAQQRFMFSQHPKIAKRWAAETPNIKALPEKVSEPNKPLRMSGKAMGVLSAPRKPRLRP